MKTMRGSDIIAAYLEAEQVPYVFALCGHGNVGLLDSLRDSSTVKTISVHHEAVAGFMADAYYRVAGRPVATLTSCGPGSAQLVVALATALMDASAFFAITGNVPTGQFNRGPFQESGYHYQADFPSVARPNVKRSFQATRVEQLPLMLRQGFSIMTRLRPGPVHLDVPLNVFAESAEVESYELEAWHQNVSEDVSATPEDVQRVTKRILAAERPLLLLGNCVQAGRAADLLVELVAKLGIPAAWTPDAKGVLDPRDALHVGEIGRNGSLAANQLVQEADLILAVAARFDDRASGSWVHGEPFSIPPTRLIQVEIHPDDLARNFPVELGLLAAPHKFLEQLLVEVAAAYPLHHPARWDAWRGRAAAYREEWLARLSRETASQAVPVRPERLLADLRRVFPDDGILLSDVGVHHNWVVQTWPSYRAGTLLQSWGFAAMGFGMAGALGAKLAAPERPVLAVVGDGGFLMNSNVVSTAVEYEIPVVWLVWNNGGYISIRDIQRAYFGAGREFCTEFRDGDGGPYSANYAAMAQAMGATALQVTHPQDLAEALDEALRARRPVVVDVTVDPDVAPLATAAWELPPLPVPKVSAGSDALDGQPDRHRQGLAPKV